MDPDMPDFAFSIRGFARAHAVSRTFAYNEIAAGRLIARKAGSRTIILAEDAAAWRAALPRIPGRTERAPTR